MDLKPQNILLSGSKKEPRIKVADFGFAKILKETSPGPNEDDSWRGSLLYMAPEIILSRYAIYAFRSVLHIMLNIAFSTRLSFL